MAGKRNRKKNNQPPLHSSVPDAPEPGLDPARTPSKFVRFLRTLAAEDIGAAPSPFICVCLQGLETPLALSQLDAINLLASLASSLATQNHRMARRVVAAWGRWEWEENHRRDMHRALQAFVKKSPPVGKERLVSRDALEQTYAEVCKVGPTVALDLLLREPEPDLAAFLEAHATALQKELVSSRNTSSDSRDVVLAIATTALAVLRKAHYEMWLNSAIGTRLAQLDPNLADDSPSAG